MIACSTDLLLGLFMLEWFVLKPVVGHVRLAADDGAYSSRRARKKGLRDVVQADITEKWSTASVMMAGRMESYVKFWLRRGDRWQRRVATRGISLYFL